MNNHNYGSADSVLIEDGNNRSSSSDDIIEMNNNRNKHRRIVGLFAILIALVSTVLLVAANRPSRPINSSSLKSTTAVTSSRIDFHKDGVILEDPIDHLNTPPPSPSVLMFTYQPTFKPSSEETSEPSHKPTHKPSHGK